MAAIVDPLNSLASASQMLPVGTETVQPVGHLNPHNPSANDLEQRFSSMMNAPHADHLFSGVKESVKSQAIDNGEELLKQIQASRYMGVRC